MASDKRPPQQRRRRPPTVINLEATEVGSGPVAPEPRVEAAAEPPAAEPVQPEPSPKPDDVFIPPPPERPSAAAQERGRSEPPRSDLPHAGAARRPIAWLPDGLSSAVRSGIAAVAGGLLVFVLIWLTGALSRPREAAVDLSPRLAAIERQLQDLVRDLAARPTPASVDPKAIDDLAARMARLESAQSAPRAPVTDPVVLSRLSAAEQAAKALAANVAALARRSDGVEGALRDSQGRLERMSAALNELRTAARSAAAGSDRAARLALAVGSLRVAVERSEPFAAELAAVKPLTSDAVLAQELAGLIKPMLRTASEPRRDGGFLERMQANAESLVRVRPVGDVPGDDRDAILARVEQRAAQSNVPGALAELAKLSPQARAPVEPWIAKVEARNQAIEASRRLAAEAVAALNTAP